MSIGNLLEAAREVSASWWMGDVHPLKMRRLDAEVSALKAASPEQINEALNLHGDDNINVDSDALVSESPEGEGYWVQAWVWVPRPNVLNEYTCPSCGTEWEEEWECACNDDCPNCGLREVQPDGDGS